MLGLEIFDNIRYMQYLATLSATLSITCTALYAHWPSPTLPKLTSNDSPIGTILTDSEASWVASSFLLGWVPGGILSGLILSRFGPKTALLVSAVPMFVPWLAIIYAKSALTLCLARFVGGIGSCISSTAVPIYNGEVSDKDIRGKLGSTFNTLYILGSVFILALGPFVSYKMLSISSSIFPLLFGIIFWAMPESPYYLVKINQRDLARHNLTRLLAKSADKKVVQVQLDEVSRTIEYDMMNKSTLWELLTKPEYRRPLIIMTGIKFTQNFNGGNAIEAYMQTIIETSKSSISPELSSILFGVIQIPAVLVAATLVDKVGRRPLLIISCLGCALALALEGLYFYLQDNLENSSIINWISWVPTTGLVLFLVMGAIGLGTVPYVLLGEMFPTNIKGHAVSLFSALGGILGFLVIIFFETISRNFGLYITFSVFTAVSILGTIFIYFTLPETKGNSFVEIQANINKISKI